MPDKIIIEDVAPGYDGTYEFEIAELTNRDFHTIKQLSGVRAGELLNAIISIDTDVVLALALIMLRRAGKPVLEDLLWDAEGGRIQLILDDTDGDAVPPAQAPPSSDDDDSSDGGKSSSSGTDSEPSLATSETTP